MKKINAILALGFSLLSFVSCSKWTETEIKRPLDMSLSGNTQTEAYYQALREYKQQDHPIAFGWFGNWTGQGYNLQSQLAGIPDSMDVVSIWRGDWTPLTPAQKADKEYVQKVKGTKVLITGLLFEVGDKITPKIPTEKVKAYNDAGIATNEHWTKWRHEFWGYVDDTDTSEDAESKRKMAIVKYANALCDSVFAQGYDGFDFDIEAGIPQPFSVRGELFNGKTSSSGRFSHNYDNDYPYLRLFLTTICERIGPSAKTPEGRSKIFVVDGEPELVPSDLIKNVSYFILQAYSDNPIPNYDTRVSKFIERFAKGEHALPVAEVCKRLVFTADFEAGAARGGKPGEVGQILRFAAYNPTVDGVTYRKGGVGAYHMEYEYSASPSAVVGSEKNGYFDMSDVAGATYPWLRKSIKIMNPVVAK